MPEAEPFKALAAGNGFSHGLSLLTLNSNQTLTGDVSLKDAMNAYWNVSRAQFGATDVNLAGGFTFRDPQMSAGSLSYEEITPKSRVNGISSRIEADENNPEIDSLNESFIQLEPDNSDISIEDFTTTIHPTKYALDSEGKKRYFHGIKFQYTNSLYGTYGYGSMRTAMVTFDSRPMYSSAGLAAVNQNTSHEEFGLVTQNDSDGFSSTFNEVTQSVVNIQGLKFVKTIHFRNQVTQPGSFPGDVFFDTVKTPITSVSNPLLEFYTYPEPE